eukprot:366337-Chlamydomonas_euryale.AAC.7
MQGDAVFRGYAYENGTRKVEMHQRARDPAVHAAQIKVEKCRKKREKERNGRRNVESPPGAAHGPTRTAR